MKTIGLIGGMSWESTAHYYTILNQETARRLGGLHSAPILLHSVDFAPIAQMQSEGKWDEMGDILAQSAKNLQAAGADLIGMATNTMHMLADQITSAISVPFVHIAQPTATELQADGIDTVALLGTKFTMEMPFYRDHLAQKGFEVLVPEVDITNLNAIIYEELCRGIVTEQSRKTYEQAIQKLAARGAQAVILGCTEIAMLIGDDNSPIPTYDTTALHAKALVDAALDT
jgi:aspartate racemase